MYFAHNKYAQAAVGEPLLWVNGFHTFPAAKGLKSYDLCAQVKIIAAMDEGTRDRGK